MQGYNNPFEINTDLTNTMNQIIIVTDDNRFIKSIILPWITFYGIILLRKSTTLVVIRKVYEIVIWTALLISILWSIIKW